MGKSNICMYQREICSYKLFCHIDYKAMVATDVFFYCVLPMDLVSPPSAISMRYYNAIISVNNIKKNSIRHMTKAIKCYF